MSAFFAHSLLAIDALLLLPAAVLLTEILCGLRRQSRRALAPTSARPRVAVLIPAHNEAATIADTLRSLAPQLTAVDRLLVVADNCTDHTAALAVAHGAEVIVRTDNVRRGKGYALEAGVRHLRADPPEVVIIIDADCQAGPDLIDRVAHCCIATGRPMQANYAMRVPLAAPPSVEVAAFAWTVKNELRPSGLLRLGLPCQLMGTGMGFPWHCINSVKIAGHHLVEDLKLGIDLARSGSPPLYCPEAEVVSSFPVSRAGIKTQRTRWEHGHMGTLLSEAPSLLWLALRRRDLNLLALALDLCVPPLALLVLMTTMTGMLGVALAATSTIFWPLALSLLASLMLTAAVAVSRTRYRSPLPMGRTALLALGYVVSKLPMYLRFFSARETQWVRSARSLTVSDRQLHKLH